MLTLLCLWLSYLLISCPARFIFIQVGNTLRPAASRGVLSAHFSPCARCDRRARSRRKRKTQEMMERRRTGIGAAGIGTQWFEFKKEDRRCERTLGWIA